MPKVKRNNEGNNYSENKKKKLDDRIETDLSKSFSENVENRFKYWENMDKQIEEIKSKICILENRIQNTIDIPENRPLLSDLRIQIKKLSSQIKIVERSNNKVLFYNI